MQRCDARACLGAARAAVRLHSSSVAALPPATHCRAPAAAALHAAKPFNAIPGPRGLPLVGNTWRFIKGIGTYADLDLLQQQVRLREEFGDIVRISGIMGRNEQLWIYDPQSAETVLRNEGRWPYRDAIQSLHYYRTVLNKERFKSMGGTITTQGEDWRQFRSKVSQTLMHPRSAVRYMQPINEVADEFVEKIHECLDENQELPADFMDELQKWSVESIAAIALDKRIGLLARDLAPDSEPRRLIDAVHTVFNSFYLLDWQPSVWRYVSTPAWRRFVSAMDVFTDIAEKYIQEAMERIKHRRADREPSVLEHLLKDGPAVANLMASDMLFGGTDTTSNATAGLLFHLAKNPQAQEKLAEEVRRVLPNSTKQPITAQSLEEMPYLRSCLKESLRVLPVVIGISRKTPIDLVLRGYKVPKDVDVFLCHMLMSRDEKHYPRPLSFEPERWLRGDANAHSAHPFVTLPFGFGPRTCVGRRFAELEVHTLVAKIVRRYKVEYHHGDELQYTSTMMNAITSPLKFRLLKRK